MSAPQRETSHPDGATAENLNALLGKGSEFEGKLSFEGMVRIDGKFTGQISTNDVLIVAEGARVAAEISCGSIIVRGEVTGNIRAKTSIELHHPAKLRGDVTTPSLLVEKGVVFQGQSKMENLEKELPRYELPNAGRGSKNGPHPTTASETAEVTS